MNVCLFTSVYFNNIGNGFIDLGAEQALIRALPDNAQIIKVSQCANFAASMSRSFALKEIPLINSLWVHTMQKTAKKVHDQAYKTITTKDVDSIPKMFIFDYMIIPGCVLTVPFFTIYGELLRRKIKQGTKLIFLGASGNFYTEYEISYVTKWLKELKPYALITRDSVSFKHYSSISLNSYNGIDNVFFVNLLNIPTIQSVPNKYVVVNLEEPKHKELKKALIEQLSNNGKDIVFTNHKPFPYSNVSKLVKNGIICSDYPLDYLVLYKNAEAVYSDRVHACIPTLSFGNIAKLFSDSPRKALFENVEIINREDGFMELSNLSYQQNQQIDFLKTLF